MRRHTRVMTAGALLGLGIWIVVVANGRADDDKKAKEKNGTKESILKIAETMKKDAPGAKKLAEDLAKKVDLEEVMFLFKFRAKGGVGFDDKADAKSDGIEKKYLTLATAKPAVTKKELQDKAADYARMIEITQAIAEVTQHVDPPKAKAAGKGPKDWKKYTEDMKKATNELSDAVKGADPAKVKTAAMNVNSACNSCHSDFRD